VEESFHRFHDGGRRGRGLSRSQQKFFHELRGQFHEVPVNAHAIQRGDFHIAAELVQQMAEFMEDGGDFIVREQCRIAIDRRGHVAADEA
jgi:hypothetical protein